MTLLGQDVLTKAGRRNRPLRTWLTGWAATVANAMAGPEQASKGLSLRGRRAVGGGTTVTVFNVKGNDYRLLTWIDYGAAVVEVLEVISHAEYDKQLWKERY